MLFKRVLAVSLALTLGLTILAAGCVAPQMSQEGYQGGAVGAGVGAAAGAILDSGNRWRGGVIGATLGAILGGSLAEIRNRAGQQAVQAQQPVRYQSQDGRQAVYVEPGAQRGNCQLVKEKFYQNGRLVRVTERQVCR